MPLWNETPHKPTEYEIVRLSAALRGRSSGGLGEWAWHGHKARGGRSPTLSGTNLGVFAQVLQRHPEAPEQIRTWGEPGSGILQAEFKMIPALVRQPETIVKVKSGPPEDSPLAVLAARCEGLEGDSECEWSMTRVNQDAHIAFFTSIPAQAGRLIRRNAGAILRHTVYDYEDSQFGVMFHLDVRQCRHPALLVRVAK